MKSIKLITLICASFVLTTITSGQDTLKFERTTTIQTLENGNINIATNPIVLQQTLDSIYTLHARMADSLQSGTVTGTSKFLRLLETLETGGDVLVGGDLEVIGSATIGGTTFANGGLETTNLETDNITVSENGSFGQDVSVGGTLTVTGATTLNSTLSAQTSTLSSATITGDASIGGNTSMTGALDVDGSSELDGLNVDGATTLDAFTADGNADINGNADVSGTLNAGASTLSSATVTGNVDIEGTLDVSNLALATLTPKAGATQIQVTPSSSAGDDETVPGDYPLLITGTKTGLWIELETTGNDMSSFAGVAGESVPPPGDDQNFITFGTSHVAGGVTTRTAYGRIEGTGAWSLAIEQLFSSMNNVFDNASSGQSNQAFAASMTVKIDIKNHSGLPTTSTPYTDYFPGYLMVMVKSAQNSWISPPSGITLENVFTGFGSTAGMSNPSIVEGWTGERDNYDNGIYSDVLGHNKTDDNGNCDSYECAKWVFIDPITQPGVYTIKVPEGAADDHNGLTLRWVNANAFGPNPPECSGCSSGDLDKSYGMNDKENRVGIKMTNTMGVDLLDINYTQEDHSFLEMFTGQGHNEWHLEDPYDEDFTVATVSPDIHCTTATSGCSGGRVGEVEYHAEFFNLAYPPYYDNNPGGADGVTYNNSEFGWGATDFAWFDIEKGAELPDGGEVGGGSQYSDSSEEPSEGQVQSTVSGLQGNADLASAALEEVQMVIDVLQNIIDFVVSFFPPGVPFDFFDILDAAGQLFMSIYDIYLYFYDGVTSTGIQFVSRGADYAEFVPKADPLEFMAYGDVVGVKDGLASKSFFEADHYFVVSKAPLVLGNAVDEHSESHMEKLAFLGQVPVKVKGMVESGDYVLACDDGSGIAEAKNSSEMSTSDYSRVVGVAWESSAATQEKRGLKGPYQLILTAIGLDNNNFVAEMNRVQDEVDNLKEIVNSLVSSLNKLGADIAVPDLQLSSSNVSEEANTMAWEGSIDKMMNSTLTRPADEALYEAAKRFEDDPVGSRKMFADILEDEMGKRFGLDIQEDFPWFRKIIEDPEFAGSVREVCEREIRGLHEMLEERSNPDKSTSNLRPEKTMPGARNPAMKRMPNASNKSEEGASRPKIR